MKNEENEILEEEIQDEEALVEEEAVEESHNEIVDSQEEDKYIKLTPRRFYTTVIVTSILVFVTMVTLIFGGNYAYQQVQINKQVDQMIENVLASSNSGQTVDGKIEEGMIAVIDYEGSIDGKTFDGGTATNYSLEIGSNTFIDGFEEQLIGSEKGDKLDVKVTFPEDYNNAEVAGKDAVFKVEIIEVQKKIVAELNDEFVQSLGMEGIETVKQLKDYLKDYIKSQGATTGY